MISQKRRQSQFDPLLSKADTSLRIDELPNRTGRSEND